MNDCAEGKTGENGIGKTINKHIRVDENHCKGIEKAARVTLRSGVWAQLKKAAHWQSLRTTNPIESTFATIRLRTAKTRNCLSEKTALSLVHQLAMSAEKRWRRLRGLRYLADVITDVRFIDGMNEKETGREAAEFKTAIHQIWP